MAILCEQITFFCEKHETVICIKQERSFQILKVKRPYFSLDLSPYFPNDLWDSVTSFKSLTQHDAHFVDYGALSRLHGCAGYKKWGIVGHIAVTLLSSGSVKAIAP